MSGHYTTPVHHTSSPVAPGAPTHVADSSPQHAADSSVATNLVFAFDATHTTPQQGLSAVGVVPGAPVRVYVPSADFPGDVGASNNDMTGAGTAATTPQRPASVNSGGSAARNLSGDFACANDENDTAAY